MRRKRQRARRTFYWIARAREVGKEVQHLMTSAGLLYWPFAKYMVSGADAGAFLDSLVASRMPKPGKVTEDRLGTQRGTRVLPSAAMEENKHIKIEIQNENAEMMLNPAGASLKCCVEVEAP